MNIEKGEYFRTKDGQISKNNSNYAWSLSETYINDSPVIKHSKNIIDLIEIGDIVEWWYEDNYIQDFVKDFVYKELLDHLRNSKCNEDIKSIVTKEQYKSVEYQF